MAAIELVGAVAGRARTLPAATRLRQGGLISRAVLEPSWTSERPSWLAFLYIAPVPCSFSSNRWK
jgi:hypothetical protein